MSVHVETFYRAVCDGCGESPDLDGGEFARTISGALESAEDDDRDGLWFQAANLVLCPSCLAANDGDDDVQA